MHTLLITHKWILTNGQLSVCFPNRRHLSCSRSCRLSSQPSLLTGRLLWWSLPKALNGKNSYTQTWQQRESHAKSAAHFFLHFLIILWVQISDGHVTLKLKLGMFIKWIRNSFAEDYPKQISSLKIE